MNQDITNNQVQKAFLMPFSKALEKNDMDESLTILYYFLKNLKDIPCIEIEFKLSKHQQYNIESLLSILEEREERHYLRTSDFPLIYNTINCNLCNYDLYSYFFKKSNPNCFTMKNPDVNSVVCALVCALLTTLNNAYKEKNNDDILVVLSYTATSVKQILDFISINRKKVGISFNYPNIHNISDLTNITNIDKLHYQTIKEIINTIRIELEKILYSSSYMFQRIFK